MRRRVRRVRGARAAVRRARAARGRRQRAPAAARRAGVLRRGDPAARHDRLVRPVGLVRRSWRATPASAPTRAWSCWRPTARRSAPASSCTAACPCGCARRAWTPSAASSRSRSCGSRAKRSRSTVPGRRPPARPQVKAELLEPSRRRASSRSRRVVVPFNPETPADLARGRRPATLSFRLDLDAGAEGDVAPPHRADRRARRAAARWSSAGASSTSTGGSSRVEEELDLFASDGRPLRAALAVTLRRGQPTRRAVM